VTNDVVEVVVGVFVGGVAVRGDVEGAEEVEFGRWSGGGNGGPKVSMEGR